MSYIPEIGECVRIRDYTDLKMEFNCLGTDIEMPYAYFVAQMRALCGNKYVVSDIQDPGSRYKSDLAILCLEAPENDPVHKWTITSYMVEPADSYKFSDEPPVQEEFLKILNVD